MSIKQTTTMTCDECGKAIKDNETPHVLTYSPASEPVEEGVAPNPTAAVTMHFHDKCFNRQSALKAERIDKLTGRA